MKTLLKSVVAVFAASVFVVPVSAVSYEEVASLSVQDTIVKKDTTVKKEAPLLLAMDEVTYTKIETNSVPSAVTDAVASKYDGYTISEAYKGSDKSYKLIVKKADVSLTVYFNETGDFLKEEAPAETTNNRHQI